jgi:hypothetical protein
VADPQIPAPGTCGAVHPDYDGSHHYAGTCDVATDEPGFHAQVPDEEGTLWDHAHMFEGEPSMLWNTPDPAPDPPYADRFHASLDPLSEPTFTAMCGPTFTRNPPETPRPEIACVDCLQALLETCADYADRITTIAHAYQGSWEALRVVDEALARPGPARRHGLPGEDDDPPADPPGTFRCDPEE